MASGGQQLMLTAARAGRQRNHHSLSGRMCGGFEKAVTEVVEIGRLQQQDERALVHLGECLMKYWIKYLSSQYLGEYLEISYSWQ